LGGEIARREVGSLDEPLAEVGVVVNCAGLGARQLVGDDQVYPVRGQIVRVEPLPVDRILLDEDEERGLTYIVPRSADCILGGTAELNNWSLEPDMATAQAIIERCARLVPEVREARVLGHMVGLRPGRDAVRLEAERKDGGLVVHNYGHSGAGITLSWACAEEVAGLVARQA
jgi:D-amino-acid oxidase